MIISDRYWILKSSLPVSRLSIMASSLVAFGTSRFQWISAIEKIASIDKYIYIYICIGKLVTRRNRSGFSCCGHANATFNRCRNYYRRCFSRVAGGERERERERESELIILLVASRVGRSFHGDWSSDSSRLRRLRRKEPLKSTIADRSFFLNADSPRDFPSIFIEEGGEGAPVCNRLASI